MQHPHLKTQSTIEHPSTHPTFFSFTIIHYTQIWQHGRKHQSILPFHCNFNVSNCAQIIQDTNDFKINSSDQIIWSLQFTFVLQVNILCQWFSHLLLLYFWDSFSRFLLKHSANSIQSPEQSKSNTWGTLYMCTHTCGACCLSLFFEDLWALLCCCCCCWRRICRATCKAWVRKKTDKNNVRKQKFMNNSFSSVMFLCWGLTLPWERLYCFLSSKMLSKWCHAITAGLDTVFSLLILNKCTA